MSEHRLWERMPGESDQAFAKFCAYRDLGPERSLGKLAQRRAGQRGWSETRLHHLCEQHSWVARASAWDEEQDRIRRQAQLEAIKEMAERQARDGMDMQRLSRGAMAKWVKQDPQTGQTVLAARLRPSEVARLYRLGFEVERLARRWNDPEADKGRERGDQQEHTSRAHQQSQDQDPEQTIPGQRQLP